MRSRRPERLAESELRQRAQARTRFRRRTNPPRRSGEARPLRAFRLGCRVGSARGIADGSRRRGGAVVRCHGERHQHACALPVAMATVRVRRRGGALVSTRLLGHICRCRRMAVIGVIVVPDMVRRRTRFVGTVTCHCRPGHLGGQQNQQQDGEPTAHGAECNGYRVDPEQARLSGSVQDITTALRGRAPRCRSSSGGPRARTAIASDRAGWHRAGHRTRRDRRRSRSRRRYPPSG